MYQHPDDRGEACSMIPDNRGERTPTIREPRPDYRGGHFVFLWSHPRAAYACKAQRFDRQRSVGSLMRPRSLEKENGCINAQRERNDELAKGRILDSTLCPGRELFV